MRGIGLASNKGHGKERCKLLRGNPRRCHLWRWWSALGMTALVLAVTGCSRQDQVPVRKVQIQQAWELQPGKTVGGHPVVGGLGDISIRVGGDRVFAPFNGVLQPNDLEHCFIFSSPDVPAYLFRYCGLRHVKLGQVKQGDPIGRADYLEFAAMRRQPDGKWTMVEPAANILERSLVSE